MLFTYGNIFVLDEEAVEEPDDGADSEGEGEGKGHELHTPGTHHKALQTSRHNTLVRINHGSTN